MTWRKVNDHHMQNGDWTITKAVNVAKPYQLWHDKDLKGSYLTSTEAMDEWRKCHDATKEALT